MLRPVTHILIHTAGTPRVSLDISAKGIRAYHILERGWRDIGYHKVIRFNGAIEAGRALDDDPWLEYDEIGAGVHGGNLSTVHICFSGNGDLRDLTELQKAAGSQEAARLLNQFKISDESFVLGHRECHQIHGVPIAHKTCPGKLVDMDQFRSLVGFEIDILKASGVWHQA